MNEELFNLAKNGPVTKIAILLGKGADLSETDGEGKTALMHAAENDKYAVAAVLLDKKYNTDINVQDKTGKTALIHACIKKAHKTVAVILDKKLGADLSIKDNGGKTAMDYAEENGDKRLTKLLAKKL